ncbi:MAG: hypothetical protein ABSH22_20640, partial [Tepidisphaeraceae bacterium]
VSDQGLKELAGLTQLEELYLIDCPVTDASVQELAGFKKLKVLFCPDAHFTAAGVKTLQQQLPDLRIYGP